MEGNPGRNLVDFFISEACHDCKGRIPMINGLSVKNPIYIFCAKNELKSKNSIKFWKVRNVILLMTFLKGIFETHQMMRKWLWGWCHVQESKK